MELKSKTGLYEEGLLGCLSPPLKKGFNIATDHADENFLTSKDKFIISANGPAMNISSILRIL